MSGKTVAMLLIFFVQILTWGVFYLTLSTDHDASESVVIEHASDRTTLVGTASAGGVEVVNNGIVVMHCDLDSGRWSNCRRLGDVWVADDMGVEGE